MPFSRPALGDRSLFSSLEATSYLHHAGISPLSDPVVAAISEAAADFGRRGTGAFFDRLETRDALRQTLAGLLGGSAEDIGFVPNTAWGLNAIAWSFPFEPGDGVVLFDGEYPSNVVPFLRVAQRFDLRVELLSLEPFADPGGPDFAALDQALARRPRLLSVSAVQFQTGLRMPLAEIAARCKRHGVRLCVDGVQACGAMPLDVEALGIDYLACGAHKWLMGPDGAGFVSIRPDAMAELRPALVGAMSYEGTLDMLTAGPGHLRYDHPLVEQPTVFENGMLSSLSIAGFLASTRLLSELGPARTLAHAIAFGDRLEPALRELGFRSLRLADPERRSAILALEPPPGHPASELAPALSRRGIICGCPDGKLRLAPHFENALDEIDDIVAAVEDALSDRG